jgi:hypothetical protein
MFLGYNLETFAGAFSLLYRTVEMYNSKCEFYFLFHVKREDFKRK